MTGRAAALCLLALAGLPGEAAAADSGPAPPPGRAPAADGTGGDVLPGAAAVRAKGDTLPAAADSVARYRAREIRVTVTRSERRLGRVPFAVSRLGRRELQAGERGLSLAEGLEQVPGVVVQNRRNFSLGDRVTLRGAGARAQFGVRGLRVLADGIPLTLPDGQTVLTNLDLASAGSVEVLRGPASALYGNAAGGVLRYRTEGFSPDAFTARPRVEGGSHGYRKAELTLSGTLGAEGGLSYLGSFHRIETDGFRRHAHAELYRANLVGRLEPGPRTTLRPVLNLFSTPFAENPSSLGRRAARRNPRTARSLVLSQGMGEESHQQQAGASLRHRWSPGGELTASAWAVHRDVWNPIPFRIIDLDRVAGGVRSVARGPLADAGDATWQAGFDASVQRDRRRETENLGRGGEGERAREGEILLRQTERVWAAGPFARLELRPASGLRLSAGARWDVYRFRAEDRHLADGDDSGRRTLTHVSPTAGLTWSPVAGLTLYGNYSTAFETPTASELSNRPSGEGGFNPDLGPQTLHGFEAGIRGSAPGGLGFEVTGYRTRVEGALVPFEGPGEEVFHRNAGEVLRRGLEVSADWTPVRALSLHAAYTFHRGRYETFVTGEGDFSGNREPGVPDHRLYAGVDYRAPFGLRASLGFRWTDDYPVNDANDARDWAARVVDLRLRAGRSLGPLGARPFLGIDNLFDERYNGSVVPNAFGGRYYEPAPGRELFAGLRLSLGGGGAGAQ